MISGINILQEFEYPKKKSQRKYNDFLNYINDEEKQQNNYKDYEFQNYNNYMYDDKKTNSLFSNMDNKLSNEDIEIMKNEFQKAQDNNSFLWKTVISFDNEYLKNNNILNGSTLNEELLKNIARNSMVKMLSKEGINDYIFSGAIHSNTDNIHIHLATVERNTLSRKPYDKKGNKLNSEGRFKISSFELGKSTINSSLNKDYEPMKKIDQIIRETILRKDINYNKGFSRYEQRLVNELLNELPRNKNLWQYNNKAIRDSKPKIKELSKLYLENNFKDELKELDSLLDKQEELYSKTYGKGENDRNKYKENKIDDMYSRVSNKILKELKIMDTVFRKERSLLLEKKKKYFEKVQAEHQLNLSIRKLNQNIKQLLNSEKYKNQLAYEELEMEIEIQNKGYIN